MKKIILFLTMFVIDFAYAQRGDRWGRGDDFDVEYDDVVISTRVKLFFIIAFLYYFALRMMIKDKGDTNLFPWTRGNFVIWAVGIAIVGSVLTVRSIYSAGWLK